MSFDKMPYTQFRKQLNLELREKGYNGSKRKEIIEQAVARKKANKQKKKQRGVFILPPKWIESNITASLPRQSCLRKLKLRYPLWHTWHHYIKMATIPTWASGFAVHDGNLWIAAHDLAVKLHIQCKDVIYHYILKLHNQVKYHEVYPTYYSKLNKAEQVVMPWLCIHVLHRIEQM